MILLGIYRTVQSICEAKYQGSDLMSLAIVLLTVILESGRGG